VLVVVMQLKSCHCHCVCVCVCVCVCHVLGLHTAAASKASDDDDDDADDGVKWLNADNTTPRYFNWRRCRRRRHLDRCNSVQGQGQGRCVAVSGGRQMVLRRCESTRRRAVCARPARHVTRPRRRRRPPAAAGGGATQTLEHR